MRPVEAAYTEMHDPDLYFVAVVGGPRDGKVRQRRRGKLHDTVTIVLTLPGDSAVGVVYVTFIMLA